MFHWHFFLVADGLSTSTGNGNKVSPDAGVLADTVRSELPAIAKGGAPMQALLDEVRRLQLTEQAHLAEKSRQLREQQDLLLAQQGANLKKQQKQLQTLQVGGVDKSCENYRHSR